MMKKKRNCEQLSCTISKFQAFFIETEHYLNTLLPYLEHQTRHHNNKARSRLKPA